MSTDGAQQAGRRSTLLHHEQASLSEDSKSHPQRHRRCCRDWDALLLILTRAWPVNSHHRILISNKSLEIFETRVVFWRF
jgi:hypothetical protein